MLVSPMVKTYSAYIDGIYAAVDVLKAATSLSITLHELRGAVEEFRRCWSYESLSLSFTKDPRLFINLLFTRRKKGDLDDGYGAWRWISSAVVITREQVSAGRVFNPGNDLLVLEFDAANHVMTVFGWLCI